MNQQQYSLVPRQLVPQDSTVDYFRAVQGPLRAINDGVIGQSVTSLGNAVVNATPASMASKLVRRKPVAGLGQTDFGMGGTGIAVVAAVFLVVTGALSYQAGKAMAPSSKNGKTWGWIGVPVGILTGPWGLGIMGALSNSKKGR